MSKLSKDQEKKVFSLLKEFNVPFSSFPIGEEFKLSILFPEGMSASDLSEETIPKLIVRVTGKTIETEASIYKVAYLYVDVDKKITYSAGKTQYAKKDINNTRELRSKKIVSISAFMKSMAEDKFSLSKATFKVVGQVPVLNKFADGNEFLMKSEHYQSYPDFVGVANATDFDDPASRKLYREARVKLLSSGLKSDFEDTPEARATAPVVIIL